MSGTAQGTQQAEAAAEPNNPQAAPAAVAAPAPAVAATPATETNTQTQASPPPPAAAAPNAAAEALDVSDFALAQAEITNAVLEGRHADAKAMRAKLSSAKSQERKEPSATDPNAQAQAAAGETEGAAASSEAGEEGENEEGQEEEGAEGTPGEEPQGNEGAEDPNAANPAPIGHEKNPDRIRISHLSESDKAAQAAINALTRGGMPLAEAAAKILGPVAPATAASTSAPDPAAAQAAAQERAAREEQAVQSSARVQQAAGKVQDLQTQMDAALEESAGLMDAEPRRINALLSRANAELTSAENAERDRLSQSKQASALTQQWQKSSARAVALYPDMAKAGSALELTITGLATAAQDPNSPDYQAARKPNAPEYFAQKAAGILKIAPKGGKPPAAPAAKAPVTAKPSPTAQPPAVRPASGAKGTAPAPPQKSSKQVIDDKLAQTEGVLTGKVPAPRRAGMGMIVR